MNYICITDHIIHMSLLQALTRVGMTEAEKTAVYCIVAAVLHLGNIQFEEDPNDARG